MIQSIRPTPRRPKYRDEESLFILYWSYVECLEWEVLVREFNAQFGGYGRRTWNALKRKYFDGVKQNQWPSIRRQRKPYSLKRDSQMQRINKGYHSRIERNQRINNARLQVLEWCRHYSWTELAPVLAGRSSPATPRTRRASIESSNITVEDNNPSSQTHTPSPPLPASGSNSLFSNVPLALVSTQVNGLNALDPNIHYAPPQVSKHAAVPYADVSRVTDESLILSQPSSSSNADMPLQFPPYFKAADVSPMTYHYGAAMPSQAISNSNMDMSLQCPLYFEEADVLSATTHHSGAPMLSQGIF